MSDKQAKKGKGVLGILAGCIGEFRTVSVLAAVFVVFEVVLEVFIPLIMAQIIDVGLNDGLTSFTFNLQLGASVTHVFTVDSRTDFIFICGALTIVMALLSLCFGVLSGKCAAAAATGFSMNVRKGIYYKIQDFSFANLDRFSTAGLLSFLN